MAKEKTPIVERKKVVTIEFTLKDEHGKVLEDKRTLKYLHGFKNTLIGLEEALEGKKVGDTFSVAVPPEKGYGFRDEKAIYVLPKQNFLNKLGDEEELNEPQQDIKPGMEFETEIDDEYIILTVLQVDGDKVTVDINHPYAGKALFFDVKVIDIRDAYSDELVQCAPIEENDR